MVINKIRLYNNINNINKRYLSFLNKGLSSIDAELHFGQFPAVKLVGLPFSFIPKDIINFLEGIKPIDMVAQFKNGAPSGSAVVLFASYNDVEAALKFNKKYIGSRYISVLRCRRDEYFNIIYQDIRARRPSIPPKSMNNAVAVVKIEGLSYETLPSDVYRFCSDYITGEDCVVISANENGNPTGIAYIQLDSVELAEKAQSDLNKKYVGIRRVRTSLSSIDEAASAINYYFDN